MQTTKNMDQFNARVARIQDPRFKYVVDPESGLKIPRRITRDQVGKKRSLSVKKTGMAFILGMISLVAARYVQLELIAIEPYYPDAMVAELLIAAMIAFCIGSTFKLGSFRAIIAQWAGAAVCAVSMHNAVWIAPDQFAMILSQSYVDQILALTDPMSLYVNGTSISLSV